MKPRETQGVVELIDGRLVKLQGEATVFSILGVTKIELNRKKKLFLAEVQVGDTVELEVNKANEVVSMFVSRPEGI